MQKDSITTTWRAQSVVIGPHHPDCPNPGGSCRGCPFSYDPSLFDSGCFVHLSEAERQALRQNRKTIRGSVFLSIPEE